MPADVRCQRRGMAGEQRRVQVWHGEHLLAEYAASEPLAGQYVEVMRRHFLGLTLTVDDNVAGVERPLPAARLWEVVAP